MRAISLWQPWSSLVAIGAKQIETRHWRLPESLIGQRIAIHAAKKWERDQRQLTWRRPFYQPLVDAKIWTSGQLPFGFHSMPLGVIVATTIFVECVPTEICCIVDWLSEGYQVERTAGRVSRVLLSEQEKAFGNYAPGRFAWLSEETEALKEPIPYCGRQGIFEVSGVNLSE